MKIWSLRKIFTANKETVYLIFKQKEDNDVASKMNLLFTTQCWNWSSANQVQSNISFWRAVTNRSKPCFTSVLGEEKAPVYFWVKTAASVHWYKWADLRTDYWAFKKSPGWMFIYFKCHLGHYEDNFYYVTQRCRKVGTEFIPSAKAAKF